MECERQRERNSDMSLLTSTLFPPTNQYGEMLVWVCVTVRVRAGERAQACLEGEVLVCVALNKDQKAQRHYLGPAGLPTPAHASI